MVLHTFFFFTSPCEVIVLSGERNLAVTEFKDMDRSEISPENRKKEGLPVLFWDGCAAVSVLLLGVRFLRRLVLNVTDIFLVLLVGVREGR